MDLMRAHILLRPSVFLLTHVSSVSCEPSECQAAVVAAMASVPSQSLSDLLKSQADVYRFDLTLVDEDGAWRVTHWIDISSGSGLRCQDGWSAFLRPSASLRIVSNPVDRIACEKS